MAASLDRAFVARLEIALPTGDPSVTAHETGWPLDRLCGFAARKV